MPELPEVSPGEIIASDHINDIAGRTLQRYADQATLDLENPTPTEGELAYLEIGDSGLQQILVYDGNDWIPIAIEFNGQFLPLTGGVMTGDLRVGEGAATAEIRLLVQRSVAGASRTTRISTSNVSGSEGYGTIVHQTGASNDALILMGDGEVLLRGTTGAFRLGLERIGVPFQWKFAIASNGDLLLQSSSNGTTFNTVETWAGV